VAQNPKSVPLNKASSLWNTDERPGNSQRAALDCWVHGMAHLIDE